MLNVTVTPPTAEFDALGDFYADAPARMALNFQANMQPVTQRTLTVLRVEPPAPFPGITRLMTDRQRRAFFATNGFGGGIPHARTHGIMQGWQQEITATAAGGTAEVGNDAQGIEYVEGYQQQLFLRAVGWIYAPPYLDQFALAGMDAIVLSWDEATDRIGVP